ncbi:MAG: glycosyltransferase family 4 protein [Cyanobacteria bacterium J06555_13]
MMQSVTAKPRERSEKKIARLMLFDLSIYGHHPGYIRYLLTYWHQQSFSGEIVVLVSPRFLVAHSDVVTLAKQLDSQRITFKAITQAEENSFRPRNSGLNRNLRNFQEWRIFCRYAKQLAIDHALVMYYDTYQYPLALRLNPPCSVSGIYFRPTFHYPQFANPPQQHNHRKSRWEQWILTQVLNNPRLSSLLTLDPFVTNYTPQTRPYQKIAYLPDPIKVCRYSQSRLQEIKASLSLDPKRKLFLLFGALTERKGIYQLLEALDLLPEEISRQVAIALIGEASADNQARIEQKIAALSKHSAAKAVQIYRQYEFLPEADVQAYYEISDVVLALYQNHVGMSGILNLAAEKQKPVLSTDYGLMGELVGRYDLGLAVDSSRPEAIAQGITTLLSTETISPEQRQKMQQFAQQNHADKFAATIFGQLYSRH